MENDVHSWQKNVHFEKGLQNNDLRQRIENFQQSHHSGKAWSDEKHHTHAETSESSDDVIYDRGDEIYELVWQAQTDNSVWNKLDALCNQFLKQTTVPTLAVLLSIL